MQRIQVTDSVSFNKFNGDEMAQAARALLYSDAAETTAAPLRQAVHDLANLLAAVRDALRELREDDPMLAAATLTAALMACDPEGPEARERDEAKVPAQPRPAEPAPAAWSAKAVPAGPGRFRGIVMGPKGVKFPAGTHGTIDAAWWAAEQLCVDLMADDRQARALGEAMDGAAAMAVA